MISRRSFTYSSMIRRASPEIESLGGCSSLPGRGFLGGGRFMPNLIGTAPKDAIELNQKVNSPCSSQLSVRQEHTATARPAATKASGRCGLTACPAPSVPRDDPAFAGGLIFGGV